MFVQCLSRLCRYKLFLLCDFCLFVLRCLKFGCPSVWFCFYHPTYKFPRKICYLKLSVYKCLSAYICSAKKHLLVEISTECDYCISGCVKHVCPVCVYMFLPFKSLALFCCCCCCHV